MASTKMESGPGTSSTYEGAGPTGIERATCGLRISENPHTDTCACLLLNRRKGLKGGGYPGNFSRLNTGGWTLCSHRNRFEFSWQMIFRLFVKRYANSLVSSLP